MVDALYIRLQKRSTYPGVLLTNIGIGDNRIIHRPQCKPFVSPSAIEIQLLNYINKMQELGFGLIVMQIRIVANWLAEKAGINHPFCKEEQQHGSGTGGYRLRKDTAVAPYLVTASTDPNIKEGRTVESCETLEENCNMSHQSNEGEKEIVEPHSSPSAVTDILIIPTMNKPSKETSKKNSNETKKQITKKKTDVKKGKVYRPEPNRKTCHPKMN
ncbi:hypothetical protein HHI36_010606 [Cryptolaemus montrouzieri]|uniref:Uncharacterized protein n=1 Tax=Cryptolaemus montrouzieri TaxID=559131 RepID=A0ABD2MJC8_9CUCU